METFLVGLLRDRRWFIGLGLAALGGAACGCGASELPSRAAEAPAAEIPPEPQYLVVYRAGPKWREGEPPPEPLREHFRYLLSLHQKGVLKFAGPFGDVPGGAAVLRAADDAAARALLQADPAVTTETFSFELHRWSWIDWQAAGARSK